MSFKEKGLALLKADIDDIMQAMYTALESDTGSGDHWILMVTLDRYGFRTNSTAGAERLAEEIISVWYTNQK